METLIEQIERYHRLSLLCLGGMIICITAAWMIYKKRNIRKILESCRRIRKHGKLLMIVFLCGVFSAGNGVYAESNHLERLEEIPKEELYPAIQTVEVLPGSDLPEDAFITEDEGVYYVKNLKDIEDLKIYVQIRFSEKTIDCENLCAEYRTVSREEWTRISDADVVWEQSEEQLKAVYLFDGADGEETIYEFRVRYIDETESMEYVVPNKYVIDHKMPACFAIYTNETGELLESEEDGILLQPYYNAAKEVQFSMTITENNLDYEKSEIKVIGYDGKEQVLSEHIPEITEGKAEALINSEGHFKVQAHLIDKSGNTAIHEKKFALDFTPPEPPQITYEAENTGLLARVMNQLTFGYFAKEKITAHILVEDIVSGVKQLCYTYEDADKKETVTDVVETTEGIISIQLPFSFKGNLKISSEDRLGNVSEEYRDIGVIAESEVTHGEDSKALVNVLTQAAKTKDYYTGDVEIRFLAQDSYSGIHSIEYLAGSELQERISYEQETEIMTEEIAKEYRILSEKNNQNEVRVGFGITDNAGHQITLPEEMLPKIHIDTVIPKVEVVYDNHNVQNETYYKEPRIATVFVTERNFDVKDVHFEISGPKVEIGDWSHHAGEGCQGDGNSYHTGHMDTCVWKCDIKFEEDGEYSLGFTCTDLAGNTGSYGKVDEFVIDQTVPKIMVDYDNHEVQNEFYYAAPRKATITILEKNFHAEDVLITQLSSIQGEMIVNPIVSGWVSEGEYHQAMITYDYDGEFLFDIEYTDLAGNEAENYSEDYFVVDMTKPEIKINGVLDRSANHEEAAPLITATDINYMSGSIWCELKGYQNGVMTLEKELGTISEGEMLKLQDLAYEKALDDMYLLTAGSGDLAGNTSEIQIRFSVNRFGSVYELDPRTEQLAGEGGCYYTSEEQPIIVTETNVDTIVFREIVCSLNGEPRVLQEERDYRVYETGDESSWKQYGYELFAKNFVEEGHYVVTFYSEDRAKNISDNQSKGKQIAFAVDKTSPSILVTGVENEGRYREASKKLFVDAQDNLALKEVQIRVNDQVVFHDAKEKIYLTIPASNQWQTLHITGIDYTGNETNLDEITFLVTPNFFVQFYRNTPLFYGTMIIFTVIMITIATVLVYKRKSS